MSSRSETLEAKISQIHRSIREFKVVLTLLSIYLTIAWLNYHFNLKRDDHNLDFYFLFTFLLISGFSLFKVRVVREGPIFNCKVNWVILLFYTLCFIVSRYFKFDEMRVWLDEYTQFSYGNQVEPFSVISSSTFYDTQPPLDYVLSGFSGSIFGYSAFAIKVNALIFSFLFGALLPRTLTFFTNNLYLRWFPSFIIVFSGPVLAYSMEGRPLMIALFFSLVFLTFALNFIKTGKDWSWLFVSELLFVHTTGLQPQVFIFFSLIVLSFYLWRKKKTKEAILLLGSGFLTFLVHIPLLFLLIGGNAGRNNFLPTHLIDVFKVLNLDNLIQFMGIYKEDHIMIMGFGILPTIALFFSLRKKDTLRTYLLLLPFIFLIGYFFLFKTFVSWKFSARYTYCFFSLYGVALGISLSYFEKLFERKTFFYSILIGFFSLGVFYNFKNTFIENHLDIYRPDWEGVYKYLNREVSSEDYILRVGYNQYGEWRGDIYVGDYIFGNSLVQSRLLRHHRVKNWTFSKDLFVDKDVDYKRGGRNLYILSLPGIRPAPFRDLMTNITYKKKEFFEIDVFVIPIRENLYETTKEYFLELIERAPKNEYSVPFYESLLYLEYKFGESKEFSTKLLEDFRNIRLNKGATAFGRIMPKKDLHKQRIDHFEELMKIKWKESI